MKASQVRRLKESKEQALAEARTEGKEWAQEFIKEWSYSEIGRSSHAGGKFFDNCAYSLPELDPLDGLPEEVAQDFRYSMRHEEITSRAERFAFVEGFYRETMTQWKIIEETI